MSIMTPAPFNASGKGLLCSSKVHDHNTADTPSLVLKVTRFIEENLDKMKAHKLQEVKLRTRMPNPEVFFLVSDRVESEEAARFWDYVLTTMESYHAEAGVGDDKAWGFIGKRNGWETFQITAPQQVA
jgi:hypothetical protein